jgi:hypothetical protein
MSRRIMWSTALIMPLTLLAACNTSTISIDDQTAIYAAVARQLYTVDHTFGDEPPNFPIVYLLGDTYSPTAGDEYIDIEESVKTAVVTALSDLPAEFTWVEHRDEVPIDEVTGGVGGNGVIITLGSIEPQEDGTVQVTASIYIGNLAAGSTTYVLEKVNDSWRIIGNAGVFWIS